MVSACTVATLHVSRVWHTRPGYVVYTISRVANVAHNDYVQFEWLELELGPCQDLITFAEKFNYLFSKVITHATTQTITCLRLFRAYAGVVGMTDNGDYHTIQ